MVMIQQLFCNDGNGNLLLELFWQQNGNCGGDGNSGHDISDNDDSGGGVNDDNKVGVLKINRSC